MGTALHEYYASHDHCPFPPDPRMETDLRPGQRLDILDMREDGWCVVRKPKSRKEYYVPGNYLTLDGKTPYYQA